MDIAARLKLEESKLLQRLAEVRALIDEQRQLQARIDAALGGNREYSDDPDVQTTRYGHVDEGMTESGQSSGTKRRRSVSSEVRQFEEIVTEILSSASRPLNRNEMYDAILQRGLPIVGATDADKKNTLGSRLTRMPGVENVNLRGKRGYWLKSRVIGESSDPREQ
ncbi:hypothetical protein ACSBLW_14795 [Thioclava sp. FR2]|uniref:hypothetical protein n=1 Tax=Thioclava sp. FR2 TaxID=3445780 RepID=UPI003EB6B42F